MKKTRIFIVDDHPVVREGFVALLQEADRYWVSGQAGNGKEALERIDAMEFKPHVVLMDINMPVMDGMICTGQLLTHYPEIKVIALTMIKQSAHIRQMLESGAVGYILKSGSKQELYDAIDAVMDGRTFFSPAVGNEVMQQMTRLKQSGDSSLPRLSAREREVLELILNDFSNQQIADRLGISVRTVETHKQNLIQKTGTNSIAGLVVFAIKHDLVDKA
jgi:DNA-binding NarL/FixJ family response regulator